MVCVRDGIEFRVTKNEVVLAQPGALWYADLWRCPTCGAGVVAGIGQEPFFEAWRHGDVGAEAARLWRAGAVIINEGPVARDCPGEGCPEGGPHSRVESGTCTKCGEEGEALT